MTFDPRSEIGEDYSGKSSRHYQYNETHDFTNDSTTRIFMPNLGSFYVKSLVVVDKSTGRTLTKGVDYDCSIMDEIATERSGLEACGIIEVKNLDVIGVIISYQYVGGLHTSGYYILRHMVKMYPNGVNAVLEWDNTLNKPDEYDPSYHMHHVREIFNSNGLLIWIERIRCAVMESYSENFEHIYSLAQNRLTTLYNTLDSQYTAITQEILDVFNKLKIQGEEYIFTDNPTNPTDERGYGTWQLVNNAVLYGSNSAFIIGTGNLIAMDSEQVIRNTYIWKNISTKVQPTMNITSDKDTISEGESITFTLNTTDIPTGTSFQWMIQGADAADILGGIATGSFTINAQGIATKTVTFLKDRRTEGTKQYSFVLKSAPQVKKDFAVLDTSTLKLLTLTFQKNGLAISEANEDDDFNLVVTGVGYDNETVQLNWSGLATTDFVTPPPSTVTVGINPTVISVKTLGNITTNGDRTLTVTAKDTPSDPVIATAKLLIRDTSTAMAGKITFLSNDLVTSQVNEGSKFKIRLRTNGGRGKTIQLTYRSNKKLTEFLGLKATAVIDDDNTIVFEVEHLENNATALMLEWLEVEAKYLGTSLDVATISFKDTSKTPNYVSYFSSDVNGENEISQVDEGAKFYFIMKVPNWVPGQTPPLNDYSFQFDGVVKTLTELRTRLVGGFYSQLTFDAGNNKSDVRWINGNLLSIEFTAVADNKVTDDIDFKVQVKPNAVDAWEIERTLHINDTSQPTVTAQWSLSSATMNPITTVDEATSGGLDNTVYLWLSCTGDARGFNDITLNLTGVIQEADFVTQFPVMTKFTTVGQTLKIPVQLKADFITEGEEHFTLTASYVTGKNVRRNIISTSLIVNDNSVPLPVDLSGSSSDGDATAGFSEWQGIKIDFVSPAIAVNTKWEAQIQYANGNDASERFQLVALNGTRTANASVGFFYINPKANRKFYANNSFRLTLIRKLDDGTVISQLGSYEFKLKNDSTPPQLQLDVYTDVARTTKVTGSVDEGKTYYGRAKIINPNPKTILAINNPVETRLAKGAVDEFTGRTQNYVQYTDSHKVLRVFNPASSYVEVNQDFVFTVVNDRATNTASTVNGGDRWYRLVAIGDMVNTSLTVGTPYPTDDVVTNDPNYLRSSIDLKINDTSKTLSASIQFLNQAGNPQTTFNEGDSFKVRLNYTNATIGDEYCLDIANNSQVAIGRFLTHEFNVKKTVTSVNGYFEWSFQFLQNRTSDGDQDLVLDYINKTSNVTVNSLPAKATLLDTFKTPVIKPTWYVLGSSNAVTSVKEGDSFKLRVVIENGTTGDLVTLNRTGGRPLSDFESHEFEATKPVGAPVNGEYFVEFVFDLARNQKNDTINDIQTSIKLMPANISMNSNVTVLDTSRVHGISSYQWRDAVVGGNAINSIDEGKIAYLHVWMTGGEDQYDVRCDENGGRSVGRMMFDNYGETRTHVSDTSPVIFGFGPSLDGITNAGSETRVKAKVSLVDDPSKFIEAEILINDISADTTATINAPASINEGNRLNVDMTLTGLSAGRTYRFRATTKHAVQALGGTLSTGSSPVTYYVDYTASAFEASHTFNIFYLDILADMRTNPADELNVLYEVIDLSNSRVLATRNVPINDTSRATPGATFKLVSTNDVNGPEITSIPEGGTVYLVVTTTNYTGRVSWVAGWSDFSEYHTFFPFTTEKSVVEGSSPSCIFPIQTRKNEADNGSSVWLKPDVQLTDAYGGAFTVYAPTYYVTEGSPNPGILSTYWATDVDGVNVLSPNQINEGDTVYLIVKTIGIDATVPININWGSSTTNAADFDEGTTASAQAIYLHTYNPSDFKGTAAYKMRLKADNVAG